MKSGTKTTIRTYIVFDKDVFVLGKKYFKAGQRRRWYLDTDTGLSVDHPDSMDSRDRITISPDHYHFEEEVTTATTGTSKATRRI